MSSPNVIRVTDSKREGWGMQERIEIYVGVWLKNLKEGECLEDLNIDGRIM
jgi:hypothetical protein